MLAESLCHFVLLSQNLNELRVICTQDVAKDRDSLVGIVSVVINLVVNFGAKRSGASENEGEEIYPSVLVLNFDRIRNYQPKTLIIAHV